MESHVCGNLYGVYVKGAYARINANTYTVSLAHTRRHTWRGGRSTCDGER